MKRDDEHDESRMGSKSGMITYWAGWIGIRNAVWWYKYLFSGCTFLGREGGIFQSDSAVDIRDGKSLNIRLDLGEVVLLLHVARDLVFGLFVTPHHGSQIAGHDRVK